MRGSAAMTGDGTDAFGDKAQQGTRFAGTNLEVTDNRARLVAALRAKLDATFHGINSEQSAGKAKIAQQFSETVPLDKLRTVRIKGEQRPCYPVRNIGVVLWVMLALLILGEIVSLATSRDRCLRNETRLGEDPFHHINYTAVLEAGLDTFNATLAAAYGNGVNSTSPALPASDFRDVGVTLQDCQASSGGWLTTGTIAPVVAAGVTAIAAGIFGTQCSRNRIARCMDVNHSRKLSAAQRAVAKLAARPGMADVLKQQGLDDETLDFSSAQAFTASYEGARQGAGFPAMQFGGDGEV